MKATILVIEDDMRVAHLICRGLRESGFEVVHEHDGAKGLALALERKFNLVITDILLPTCDGLEVCRALKKQDEDYPIIMLTALGTTDDKVDGFDAGADDYMVKPFEMRELVARINALLKRSGTKVKQDVFSFAGLELSLKTKTVNRDGIELNLTPKEFNLLAYMMMNPNRVLSKSEIADKVWDTKFDTGTNFIEVYISYLRRKIDKDFEKKLIHTKPGMGFILKVDHEN